MFVAIAFVLTTVAANLAIELVGIVPVGFGLQAPAAVYFVGLALLLRDIVHERLGVAGSFLAILGGSALTVAISPALALASGAAFLFSETADLAVYTPLRKRGLVGAVLASNAVGIVADSFIFLTLAFGSLDFLSGQIVGKAWGTVVGLGLLLAWRRVRAA